MSILQRLLAFSMGNTLRSYYRLTNAMPPNTINPNVDPYILLDAPFVGGMYAVEEGIGELVVSPVPWAGHVPLPAGGGSLGTVPLPHVLLPPYLFISQKVDQRRTRRV